jgi:hypothetical protein
MTQRRFCIMTIGRTGSTWLMDAIARLPDVAVPAKNVVSNDNELLTKGMAPKYEALTGERVSSEEELIELFFRVNQSSPFAGFKSMPNRHRHYERFVARPDIAFIALGRRDVSSMVASFLMARRQGTWRRYGGVPPTTLRFTAEDQQTVTANILYIQRARIQLAQIPRALVLEYEDLCQPGFTNPRLDAYFGAPVRLPEPKPATQAHEYIENWDEFRAFVAERWNHRLASVPENLRPLISVL